MGHNGRMPHIISRLALLLFLLIGGRPARAFLQAVPMRQRHAVGAASCVGRTVIGPRPLCRLVLGTETKDADNPIVGALAPPRVDGAATPDASERRACGLGVTILPDPAREGPYSLVVMAVSPYSFAKQAGVREGDVLRALDGHDVAHMPLPLLFQKLVGAVDSSVVLNLEAAGRAKMVTLRRAIPPARLLRRAAERGFSNLGAAAKLSGDWEKTLHYSDSDLEIAMLKDPPDLKAAAAFALLAGEARAALGQREAAIQMFQQAINMARVALDPMGEVLAFNQLVIEMTSHIPDDVIFEQRQPIERTRNKRVVLLKVARTEERIRLVLPSGPESDRGRPLTSLVPPPFGALLLPEQEGTSKTDAAGRKEVWLTVEKPCSSRAEIEDHGATQDLCDWLVRHADIFAWVELPAWLSADQRRELHEGFSAGGLAHRSIGNGGRRRLVLAHDPVNLSVGIAHVKAGGARLRTRRGRRPHLTARRRAAVSAVGFSDETKRRKLERRLHMRAAAAATASADSVARQPAWADFRLVDVKISVEDFFEQLKLPQRSPCDWPEFRRFGQGVTAPGAIGDGSSHARLRSQEATSARQVKQQLRQYAKKL